MESETTDLGRLRTAPNLRDLGGHPAAGAMVRRGQVFRSAGLGRVTGADHRPALFHCTKGKDRTGWAAAVLLLLLGVDEESVREGYVVSGTGVPERTAAELRAQLGRGRPNRPIRVSRASLRRA